MESIIYISISSFLLLSTFSFYQAHRVMSMKTVAINELNENGFQIIEYIKKRTNEATSILSPTTGSSGNSVSLTFAEPNISPTTFTLSGTDIYVKEGLNSPIKLNNQKSNIDNILFTNTTNTGEIESLAIEVKLKSNKNTETTFRSASYLNN